MKRDEAVPGTIMSDGRPNGSLWIILHASFEHCVYIYKNGSLVEENTMPVWEFLHLVGEEHEP